MRRTRLAACVTMYALVATGMLLSACVPNDTSRPVDRAAVGYRMHSISAVDGSLSITYPEWHVGPSRALNTRIQHWIGRRCPLTGADGPGPRSAQDCLADVRRHCTADRTAPNEQACTFDMRVAVKTLSAGVLGLTLNQRMRAMSAGSLHVLRDRRHLNLAIESAQPITLDDLVADQQALRRAIARAFRRANGLAPGTPLDAIGLTCDPPPVPENMLVTPDGLRFTYGTGENGPLARGEASVLVAYTQLRDALRRPSPLPAKWLD